MKQWHPWRALTTGIVMIWLALGVTGCGGGYQMNFTVARDLGETTRFPLHVVGVNESEAFFWQSTSMTDYWNSPSSWAQARRELVVQPGPQVPLAVSRKDAKWQEWERHSGSVTHLVVLANLPGTHADQPGNADPRRCVLDVRQKWYHPFKRKTYLFSVDGQRLVCRNPLR